MKRRKYESDELDSFDEIREFVNSFSNDVVNEFEAQQEELTRLRDRVTKKNKGFAMKRTMLSIVVLSIIAGFGLTVLAQPSVRTDITSEIAGNPDLLSDYLRSVVNSGNTYNFNPIAAPSGANNIDEGAMYYDSSANTFYGSKDGSTWTEFATGGATSLDGAYNVGNTIDVDTSAVTLTVSDTDNNVALIIAQDDATNDPAGISVVMGALSTGTAVSINSQASGTDIAGDNWSVSQAGVITSVGITSTGSVAYGVDGTGVDVTFYGDTASSQMLWDQNGDTNGSLILTGASQTITGIDSGGNLLTITGIDTSSDSDSIVVTHQGAGDALQITTGETDSGGINLIAAASGTVPLMIVDGSTNNIDLADDKGQILIQADDPYIDAGAAGLVILDSSTPITSAEGFLARFVHSGTARTNSSAVEIQVPATQPALAMNGIVAISGQDAAGAALVQIANVAASGNADGMTITSTGSGDALQITVGETDGVAQRNIAAASQTTSLAVFDGSTSNWDGNNDVGMVHITTDDPVIDTGASLLNVTQSGQAIASAEGFLARFIASGAARTNATAVEIEVAATQPALAVNGITSINGQDAAGAAIFQVAGVGASGDADAMTITNTGAGDNLQITVGEADGVGLNVIAATSQTTSLVKVDGSTGSYLGAANIGMIHVTNDGALADVASSLLYIANSGVPTDDSRGSSLRIVDSGNASAGTAGYAVYVSATDATVEAMFIDTGKVLVDETLTATLGLQVGVGETLTANSAEGAAQQVDDDITVGNVTATTAGVTDFITLPNEPTIGTVVKIMNNVGTNFEVRTLAAGNDKINNVDTSDGAVEYLVTTGDFVVFTCVAADNWQAVSYPLAGGVRAAVTPD